jgi:hypothetical protein
MKGMIDSSLDRHWFMHTSHAAIGLATAVRLGAGQQQPACTSQSVSKEVAALRVGLVAGPEATWDLAAARIAEYLRKDQSLEVYHAWDFLELGIDDPTDYDCLVLLGWPAPSSLQRIKWIERHCRRGGALIALRAMHAEIPGWSNFAEEVLGGRQPLHQACRLLEVQRSDSAWHHPVTAGIESLIAEGEVYHGPRFSPNTTVLLIADIGQTALPVAWTLRHEGGCVFCTTLGLDDDFREPNFLRMISNAVHWTGLVRG